MEHAEILKYDTFKEGYVVPISKAQLEGAPKYLADTVPAYTEEYGQSIHGYYGVPWI